MGKVELLHIENHWKDLTILANEWYNKGAIKEAIALYVNALSKAEKLVLHTKGCTASDIPFMHIFIISCHNLSNVYQESGNISGADIMLRRAAFFIVNLLSGQECLSSEFKEMAQKELQRAVLVYSRFCEDTGQIKKKKAFIRDVKSGLSII